MDQKMCVVNKSIVIFILQILNMQVRSGKVVFLFLFCHEVVVSLSVRSLDLDGGTQDDIDDIISARMAAMNEVTGVEVHEKDVKFSVFSSELGKNAIEKSLKGDIFFLLHGWSQSAEACPWYKPMTELLLQKYPTTQVVQVDYGRAVAGEYEKAVFSSESIGLVVAHMIHKMVKEGTPHEKIVLIGHSLGAQVAGWVGKTYRSLTNNSLPTIIALDPASAIFWKRPDTRRLSKYDANVVFVIHSDVKKFGFPTNCGTIDFYPNGGTNQPGCPKLLSRDITSPTVEEALWCNHRRAWDILMAAFKNPKHFLATKCKSNIDYKQHECDGNLKVSMGDWHTHGTGSFFMEITEDVPFLK